MQGHSPFELFRAQAGETPDAPFLIAPPSACLSYAPDGFRITYGALLQQVLDVSRTFEAAGYGIGNRVALLLENRPEFFAFWLALNRLGTVIVPINPDLRPPELQYQLSQTQTDLIIVHSDLLDAVRSFGLTGVTIIGVDDPVPALDRPAPAGRPDSSTPCAYLFTSGSTGSPKACILSNGYFLQLAEWFTTQGGVARMERGAEIALTPLPLFHMNALGCTTVGMMMIGGAVVPLDRFHARTWWQVVAESGATVVNCLGVIPAILLQLPFDPVERTHRVKFALGPGVDAGHKGAFETRFGIPIVEAWAMTETGGRGITTTAADDCPPGLRCIGRPRRGMEYRLVDDTGADVERGTPGELWVRAAGDDPRDGFFSGYLNDPRATEEAWAGGWFHTGDMVYEDARGLLYFFDRKKCIVRRSGENIAVLEVEAALLKDPAVRAVAVSPVPDDLRGEEVLAIVVLADGTPPSSELARAIVARSAESLSYHKVPGYVTFSDALPLGRTQKLQRGEIKAIARRSIETGEAVDCRSQKADLRRAKA